MTEIQNSKHIENIFKFGHSNLEFACPVKYVSSYFLVPFITMVSKSNTIDFKKNHLTG
jgi:hypothetical protein